MSKLEPVCHAVFLAVLLLAPSGDALAQAAASCRGDIAKACAQTAPGGSRVSQCLRQGMEQLSPGCRAHVRAVNLQLKETRAPCEDDLLLLCEGVDLTEARIASCLARNRASLTPACRRIADLMQKRP
jgi:hypothetical protein